ncbi:hypothetical protein BDN70DRAFT_859395 [Pholiota conissans]|uniref:Alpha-ketoglutarate-dependent dioxygenase AlkB-like domain-containing protein n=1 Tax=Pholiota conissans TaxID=109636 RepID=A0A9P6CT03_9AGAR|nr:hypothetical protein BDN70DRAFT_859395 [Pholiota conissans]
MKIPCSWNDRSPLKDEPFLTMFSSAYRESGNRIRDPALITRTMEELQERTDFIVKGWLDYAFAHAVDVPPQNQSVCPAVDGTTIRLFVEVYLQLSRNEIGKALQALNRARNTKGFQFVGLDFNRPRAASPCLALERNPDFITESAVSHTIEFGDRCKIIVAGPSLQWLERNQKNEDNDRPLERCPGCNSATPKNHAAGGQVDEHNPISKALSTPNARNLRPSKQITNQQEPLFRDTVENATKPKKFQGMKFRRIASTENNRRDPSILPANEEKAKFSGRSLSLEHQIICKRPRGPSAERESKRSRVIAQTLEHPELLSNPVNGTCKCTKRQKTTPIVSNHPEHDASVNITETVQCVKLEDPIHTSLSLRPPLNVENLLRFTPYHLAQEDVNEKAVAKQMLDLVAAPPPSPTPATLLESQLTIIPLGAKSELKDIKSTISYTENNIPLSTPQLPLEDLPSITCKPPLSKFPPIWAQSRQEVCESFDWFRSYQGGVYFSREMSKGYLLSGFPSSRDRFEHRGRLIISHGGGKSESMHSINGHVSCQPASDQIAQDKSVRALLNNHKSKRPLALLIDDKYALFPYDLGSKGITYAVLGFYTVESAWAEYQPANNNSGHVVRYMFAFRWCEDQGQPWWHSDMPGRESLTQPVTSGHSAESVPGIFDTERGEPESFLHSNTESRTCRTCRKESPRVFTTRWVCLMPDCRMFWRQVEEPYTGYFLSGDLRYHPRFLDLPPYKALPFGFREIVASLPPIDTTRGSKNYHFTRGFHCIKCGRLSCRSQWEKWQCLGCGESFKVDEILRHAHEIWNQKLPVSFKDYLINPFSDIISVPSATFFHDDGRGRIQTFILPEERGRIHHIQPGSVNGRKEADSLFLEYQRQAASGILKFRRWPMRAHKCRGPLLTNYFSHNAGEPYKYVGGDANTVPFECAPAACQSRDLIQKRIKQALGVSTEFNEVLSVAYMERQKMAFHSDDEIGLGPLVASLSLGSPALMHFRLQGRYDPEREKKGILLSIVLRHGDILVMDGADIQEYYEHTVVPNNFRIAATARQIGSAHRA